MGIAGKKWAHTSNPQRQESLRRFVRPGLSARVMHSPSSESREAGSPSQDFLCLIERRGRLAFAVADGVSASFFGEIAAREVATQLAHWLAHAPLADPASLRAKLDRFLAEAAERVHQQVAIFEIPKSVEGFLRQELERVRGYGSEAMVAAGVIERSGQSPRIALTWLGDAHLRVWTRDGQVLDFEGSSEDRWSSAHGPRGSTEVWTALASGVRRVLACTDGVSFALDAIAELPDDLLKRELESIADATNSDDIAFIDIGLGRRSLPPRKANSRRTSFMDALGRVREKASRLLSSDDRTS